MVPPDTLATIETSWTTSIHSNWKLQGSLRPPEQVQRQVAVALPEQRKDELQQPRASSSVEQEPEPNTATLTTSTVPPVEDLPRKEPVRSKVPSHDAATHLESPAVDTEASFTNLECPLEGSSNHV